MTLNEHEGASRARRACRSASITLNEREAHVFSSPMPFPCNNNCFLSLPEVTGGFGDITVYEFLSFSANAHGIFGKAMRGAVSRICEDLNLGEVKYQKLSDLSKGWRQRAWLGQSLIHNPDI